MSNAFELLGLPVRLIVSRETLQQAFREAGKRLHPDAGGDEQSFAALQRASEILQSPSRRLKHWLEIGGHPLESRGAISSPIMTCFGRVSEVCQAAEALARKREAAKSALGLALLEGETHACREQLEATIREVQTRIEEACAGFADLDAGVVDLVAACAVYRDLAFLEKWLASLRALYARLA